LAYGFSTDACDEYVQMVEIIAIESLKRFVQAIRKLYEKQYLRKPTREDLITQMKVNQKMGWPGMFGSLDCIRLDWKNCPTTWHVQFIDKDGHHLVILEAICDQSL